MTKYIAALRAQYPNASITTEAAVQDGYVIMLATIMDGERKLSSATKVYCCPAAGNAVDGMEVVKDAISLTGVMTEIDTERPTVNQPADAHAQKEAEPNEGAPSSGSSTEGLPLEQPPVSTEEVGAPSAQQADGTASKPAIEPENARKQSGGTRRRPKAKKKESDPVDPADLEKARLVKLAFASDEASSKAPLNMRRQEGMPLGEIAKAFPHFVRYLTQPAGRVYVTEEVAAAAETIMREIG